MTVAVETITEERCVVRNTGRMRGRSRWVAPGRTSARHLHYGRIVLAAGDAPLTFPTANHETGLVVLRGSATVDTEGGPYVLEQYDALYVPCRAMVEVRPGPGGCDLAEISAPVEGRTRCSSCASRTCRRTRRSTSRREGRPRSASSTC